jgi:ABC-type antimicrobial peptide transport system permease subunit
MKDFFDYLKAKSTWIGAFVGSVVYFLLVQAYVYTTLTFDFSVIYEWSTWARLIFFQTWMTVVFYFVLWKPNRKSLQKEKPQSPEDS